MDEMMPTDAAPAALAIQRGVPKIPEAEKAHVQKILKEIEKDRKHFEHDYEWMRRCQGFVMNAKGEQWNDGIPGGDEDKYVANLCARHIRERTAALFAKNPRAVAKRRKRLDFALWDGQAQSLQDAMMALQGGMAQGMPPDPNVMALVTDIDAGRQKRLMLDKVGATLEILFQYHLDEVEPKFKPQAKQLIRRIGTNGVGYIKLDYQRQYAPPTPEASAQLADMSARLARLEQLSADLADGEVDENSAEANALRLSLKALQAAETVIEREGIVFDFPMSTAIIPSRRTRQLNGWIGTDHLTQEFEMSVDEIKRVYKVDVSKGKGGDTVHAEANGSTKPPADDEADPKVFHYYDKTDELLYIVSPSWPGFLKEPEAPICKLERFYPIWAVCFNELEHEKQIFPPSDVRLLWHQQKEHNRARHGLREHRVANTPFDIYAKASLDEAGVEDLKKRKPHEKVGLNVPPGTKAEDLFSAYKGAPIDPNLYDTAPIFDDIQKVSGSQEANFGGTSDSTATEASIAEGGRMSSLDSNRDDLDQVLSELADAAGQVLLMEMQPETVTEIVGPGAVWPELARSDVVRGVGLVVKAGSSGRPNKAADLANIERITPLAIQIPGLNPRPLATKVAELIDETIDLQDWLLDGAPSIMALNAMASRPPAAPGAEAGGGSPQPGTGDPATDPGSQGPAGAGNDAAPAEGPGGGQPAYPAPGEAGLQAA